MRKVRTVIYLEAAESRALGKLSERTGAPVTELARRAIAAHLRKQTRLKKPGPKIAASK
jgi:Ribbon-helix-helix domain